MSTQKTVCVHPKIWVHQRVCEHTKWIFGPFSSLWRAHMCPCPWFQPTGGIGSVISHDGPVHPRGSGPCGSHGGFGGPSSREGFSQRRLELIAPLHSLLCGPLSISPRKLAGEFRVQRIFWIFSRAQAKLTLAPCPTPPPLLKKMQFLGFRKNGHNWSHSEGKNSLQFY